MIPGVGWLKYMFRVHCMFPPKQGLLKLQEMSGRCESIGWFQVQKVQEGWSCPGWTDFVAVGRMVWSHRYCWAQGFKEQLRKPMGKYQGAKKTWDKCYHLLSPSDGKQPCLFGRGVQFNQPAFDQKTMKVSSLKIVAWQFLWRWKHADEQMMNRCSLKTRPSISQRQKEWYDLWKMMLVDAITCRNMSCTCIHHTLLIIDKCCIVTVKNCQI